VRVACTSLYRLRSWLVREFTFYKRSVTNERGRGNAPGPPFTSRPRFSAAGNALAFAVEFHGALADREVGGRLDLLHERRRLGVCLKLAAFGRGLVHVREDHRRRLDEIIYGVRAGLEEARVRPEVDHGQTRLVEIADDRLHVAEDGRVARQIGAEPVGELHHEADRWAVAE